MAETAPGATKTAAPPSKEDAEETEALYASKLEILKLLNEKRQAAGVGPLEIDATVSEAADRHCAEMVQNGTPVALGPERAEAVPALLRGWLSTPCG